jgi:hypothetical protein
VIIGFIVALAIPLGWPQAQPQKKLGDGLDVLWTEPGDVASLDFSYGVGGPEGQPQPPFRFVNEDASGTNPKVNVMDANGRKWNVKWGEEANPSTFCSRLLWACGYFSQTEYFLAKGQINDARRLQRAQTFIAKDGSFVNARFQLRAESPKYLKGEHWTWTTNPFVGTHQLQGLKILALLVSNWDTKESNLTIFEAEANGTEERRYLYVDDDWGASFGRWGNIMSRSKWDCKGFTAQTANFVKRLDDGSLHWGFKGKNHKDVTSEITVDDVRWLLQYLGRVTDTQIRVGLAASGATPERVNCFAPALRDRIEQLQRVSAEVPVQ